MQLRVRKQSVLAAIVFLAGYLLLKLILCYWRIQFILLQEASYLTDLQTSETQRQLSNLRQILDCLETSAGILSLEAQGNPADTFLCDTDIFVCSASDWPLERDYASQARQLLNNMHSLKSNSQFKAAFLCDTTFKLAFLNLSSVVDDTANLKMLKPKL